MFDELYSSDATNDEGDVVKTLNFAENFGLRGSNGTSLVIEGRNKIAENDTIHFHMTNLKAQQQYSLEFKPENIHPDLTAYLLDTYDGSKHPVSLARKTTYTFGVNSNLASAASERFIIVFKKNEGALTKISLKANRKDHSAQIDWKVINEQDIKTYHIEHSTDANRFVLIGSLPATSDGNVLHNYSFLHERPVAGDNYYRIKSISSAGKIAYTENVKLTIDGTDNGFNIYPNPVVNNQVNIEFIGKKPGSYTVRLMDKEGRLLYSTVISHGGGIAPHLLKLPSTIAGGTYQLEISGDQEKRSIQNLIISK